MIASQKDEHTGCGRSQGYKPDTTGGEKGGSDNRTTAAEGKEKNGKRPG